MTVTNSANFSPTFSLYSLATDQVQTNDGTVLPAALDTHDHTSGKGLGAGRIASGLVAALPGVVAGGVFVATDQGLFRYADGSAYHIAGALDIAQEWTAVQTLDSPVLATPTITGAAVGIPTRLAVINPSGAASADFAAISGAYSCLMFVGTVRLTPALTSQTLAIRFNADAGANYSYENMVVSWNAAVTTGATSIYGGTYPAGSATAGAAGSFKLFVPTYAGATLWKCCTLEWYMATGGATEGYSVAGGTWRSAAAITEVTFLAGSGNFAAGSQIVMYGLP